MFKSAESPLCLLLLQLLTVLSFWKYKCGTVMTAPQDNIQNSRIKLSKRLKCLQLLCVGVNTTILYNAVFEQVGSALFVMLVDIFLRFTQNIHKHNNILSFSLKC